MRLKAALLRIAITPRSASLDLRSVPFQSFDFLQKYLLVALGVCLLVDLTDRATRIDHKCGALPEFHSLPLGLADTEGLHQSRAGVGQQIDRKSELGAEAFV